MKSIFSKEQIHYIKDNYIRMSYAEIAHELGFTERQIRGKINGMGLSKLRKFDKKYFSSIDSPNKAYWLGLIYADGWVVHNTSARTYECSIELNSEDDYILKCFCADLGNVHDVEYSKNYKLFNGYSYQSNTACVRVYSKQIVEDLISIGIIPNKTKESKYPKCDTYFQDFIRGYLDGDGCIYINKAKRNTAQVSFTCSNEDFLIYVLSIIKDDLGIIGSVYKEKEYKYRLVYYRFTDVLKLLSWVYERTDVPMLKRKYNKYLELKGLAV